MKRLLFTICVLFVAITGMSQTIGEAFYVYRNDGMINTFLRNEVDSMVYSYYDTDSIRYDEIVTQVVYTEDSIYRIPLAVVDSIGFVTPETKYQPGVIRLVGTIRDYVIGSDSLTVFFRKDTPSDILPKIGDKLVTAEMSEVFVGGFLGQVEEQEQKGDTIALHCSTIGLEDVFECFYYSEVRNYQNAPNSSRALGWDWDNSFAPNPLVFSFTNFLQTSFQPVDSPFKVSPQFDVTIAPSFRGKGSIIVHPIKGIILSMDTWQRTTITEDMGVTGEASFSHDFTPGDIPVFSIIPFVWVYGEFGVFFKISGKLALDEHWKQSLGYKIHYEASYLPATPAMPIPTSIPKFTISEVDLSTEREGQFIFDGSASCGVYGEIGVELMSKKVLSSGFRFEAGLEVGGEVMLYNSDKDVAQYSTSLYEKLRATELYLKPFCKVGLETRALHIGKGDVNIVKKEWIGDTFKLVPSFTNTTLTREPSDPHLLKASTRAFGRSLFPCDLGFRLIDDSSKGSDCDNLLHYANAPQTYEHFFTVEDINKKYTLYPTVELLGLGFNMIALPSAELKEPEPYYVWDDASKTATYYYDGLCENRSGTKLSNNKLRGNTSATIVVFDPSFSEYYPKSVLFNDCKKLQIINNIEYLNTDSLKSMYEMFDGCSSLRSLNLSSFNTANVTNMHSMFRGCSSLRSLDLSSFNTANVTDMYSMFCLCSSLSSLNLSSFNTVNVTNMKQMFQMCSSLSSLNLSSFNTTHVTDMDCMFVGCSSLRSLNLSSFNTANVTDMTCMFANCSSLTSLDLSSFNTTHVTDMDNMFDNCSSLKTIFAGNWNAKHDPMFGGCENLVGGKGTKIGLNLYGYDEDGNPLYYYCHEDNSAAHIDGGKNWPGLFTAK